MQSNSPPMPADEFRPETARLLATELRSLKSKETGRDYQISIALPFAYAGDPWPLEKSPGAWPVIYLLDSDWYFGMITNMVRVMAWGERTSDAIIVGIGYPEGASPIETMKKVSTGRMSDLTPTNSEKADKNFSDYLELDIKTGGGSEFYRFIKNELVPLIDKEYRTEPSRRVLMGHSLGGLFSAYAMFQEPELFSSYIAASPSLGFANNFMFALEKKYAKGHKRLPAQLYLSAGELELGAEVSLLTNMYRFAAILESRQYEGLSLTKQVFLDNNHSEVVAPAFQAGLKLALKI